MICLQSKLILKNNNLKFKFKSNKKYNKKLNPNRSFKNKKKYNNKKFINLLNLKKKEKGVFLSKDRKLERKNNNKENDKCNKSKNKNNFQAIIMYTQLFCNKMEYMKAKLELNNKKIKRRYQKIK